MAAAPEHALGDADAQLTLLEYGSFDCPYCYAAHDVVAGLRDRFGSRLRYVFRHLPIAGDEIARRAAELAEYAYELTGDYWRAHDALMRRGPRLAEADLQAVGAELGLPPPARHSEAWRRALARVREDEDRGRRRGARFTPTFFINERRYEGPWDENSLAEALLGSLGHRVQSAALDFARWAPSTGVLLLVMTAAAVTLVNSPFGAAFQALWETPVSLSAGRAHFTLSLREWIDDGLLSIFFLVVGLEIKREFTVGRLATPRAAIFPVAAAAGGMAAPALIYLAIAPAAQVHGWAIPTTTDTAFAVALVALLGRRVPVELRIFLTAAVIVDDLAAIAIVGVFYSHGIDVAFLGAALGASALMALVNRSGVYRPLPYAALGIVLWIFLGRAGLHPTLAGVILAVFTPTRPPANLRALLAQAETVLEEETRSGGERLVRHGPSEPALRTLDAIHDRIESPAAKLLRTMEPWSSYVVLPLFALANAGLAWSSGLLESRESLVLAIVAALALGKPLGMLAGAALAVRAGIAVKSAAYSWRQLAGAGALAGIGFTMSLYIAARALPDPADFAAAKVAVYIASVVAGIAGAALLWSSAGNADASAA